VRFTLAIALVGLLITPCQAQEVRVDRIDVIEYGLYTAQATSTDTAFKPVVDAKLETTTRTIPAQVGTKFGFRYVVVGAPAGEDVELTGVVIKPGKPAYKYPAVRSIGETYFAGAAFVRQQDLIRGRWIIQLWDGERELVSESFSVE
jgi:hypothetical protein